MCGYVTFVHVLAKSHDSNYVFSLSIYYNRVRDVFEQRSSAMTVRLFWLYLLSWEQALTVLARLAILSLYWLLDVPN